MEDQTALTREVEKGPPEVDVRETQLAESELRFTVRFDQLQPGESMVLVTDRPPGHFLHLLQTERPELFEWEPLESGLRHYRVEVTRRKDGTPRGVGEFLAGEYRRLQAILGEVEWLAERRLFADALRRFRQFTLGLARHIAMEERVVFAAFERVVGKNEETAVLRAEHQVVLGLLAAIRSGLENEDLAATVAAIEDLDRILDGHVAHEARGIARFVDGTFGRGSEALVEQMQAV
jgi:uncharacterized protein (DUF2249 family)